jgi:hypothetical protein
MAGPSKPALKAAQTYGIPDEACWRYAVSADGTHLIGSACRDGRQRVISKVAKIAGWKQIAGGDAGAKLWLSTNGPVITGMDVYDDFLSCKNGVYKMSLAVWLAAIVCASSATTIQGCIGSLRIPGALLGASLGFSR